MVNYLARQKCTTRGEEICFLVRICFHTSSIVLLRSHVLTLGDPMDCSPPSSSVCGIFQARILERAAISYSRGSSRPRDQTLISVSLALAGRFFATMPVGKPLYVLYRWYFWFPKPCYQTVIHGPVGPGPSGSFPKLQSWVSSY